MLHLGQKTSLYYHCRSFIYAFYKIWSQVSEDNYLCGQERLDTYYCPFSFITEHIVQRNKTFLHTGPFIWAKHLSNTLLDKLLAVYRVHLQLINAETVISKRHSYCITVILVSAKSTSMTAVPKASEALEVSVAVFVSLHISLSLTTLQESCLQYRRKKSTGGKKIWFGFSQRLGFYFLRPPVPQFSPFKSVFIPGILQMQWVSYWVILLKNANILCRYHTTPHS